MTARWFLAIFVLLLGAACQSETAVPLSTPTAPLQPTPTLVPTQTAVAQPIWTILHPGIDRKLYEILDENGRLRDQLTIIRIDPSQNRFEVAYQPGVPLLLDQWLEQTEALLVVNGGFFTPEFVATGRIIVDGEATGQSYGEFAGMVAITDAGLEIRDLAERPYSSTDPVRFGLQAFPMLVKADGQVGYSEPGEPNRRTVIAQDGNGRILFILAPFGGFSLAELSQWLIESELDIRMALNLDGGTSTGMAIAGADGVFGLTAVPSVIAVYGQ